MRPIERIDNFMDKVDLKQLLCKVYNIIEEDSVEPYIKKIEEYREYLVKTWKENQDWRFSQVLVNTGILPNMPGYWYYMEEYEALIDLGYDPAEVCYWGQCFDKDMNRLPKTIYKPIKELTTEHLEAILDGGFIDHNKEYKKIMNDELDKR